MLIVGLMDDLQGHYKDFAHRWIETLRKVDIGVEIMGYLTTRSFKFKEFNTIVPARGFFNILFEYDLEYGKILRKFISLFKGIVRGLQTNSFIRRHKPDVVFNLAVDSLSFPFYNSIIRLPKNIKTITIIHRAPIVPGIRGKLYTRASDYVIKKSHAVVLLEPTLKEQIVKILRPVELTKIKVIPYPYFRDAECDVDKAIMPKRPTIFAIVGLITPNKGVHVALSAFARVTKEFPEARLIVAGRINDRAYKEYLYRLREGNQKITIDDRYLERQDYINLIKTADCMLLPYTRSSGIYSSGVLLDLVSFNKPMILSNIDPFRRYHEDFGLGEMYVADSVEALASTIKNVIKNGFNQKQAEAIAAVKRAHSIEAACNLVGNLLKELERNHRNNGVGYE